MIQLFGFYRKPKRELCFFVTISLRGSWDLLSKVVSTLIGIISNRGRLCLAP